MRRVLTVVSAVILFAMMLLGTVDVAGRYFFAAPVVAASEVTELLMAGLVFAAFPMITVDREHISIGLFEKRWRGAALAIRDGFVMLLIIACLGLFAWCATRQGLRLSSMRDVTDYLHLPKGPIFYFMSASCAFALVWVVVRSARRARSDSH